MDKSLNHLFQKGQKKNNQIPNQAQLKQEKSLAKIIMEYQKQDNNRPKVFTPTRKAASFKNDLPGTSSQQRISENLFFQSNTQIKGLQLMDKISQLQNRVTKLQKTQAKIIKNKRIRRRNDQISKPFKCPVQNCDKKYATQTALKKHFQIKHKQQKDMDDVKVSE